MSKKIKSPVLLIKLMTGGIFCIDKHGNQINREKKTEYLNKLNGSSQHDNNTSPHTAAASSYPIPTDEELNKGNYSGFSIKSADMVLMRQTLSCYTMEAHDFPYLC